MSSIEILAASKKNIWETQNVFFFFSISKCISNDEYFQKSLRKAEILTSYKIKQGAERNLWPKFEFTSKFLLCSSYRGIALKLDG